MLVNDNLCLGLDIGIGSLGWALVAYEDGDNASLLYLPTNGGGSNAAMGVRTFDVPENPKTKELLNKHRREVRRQRITIRRRAKRMRDVRRLLRRHGLFHAQPGGVAADCGADPWALRAAGLNRLLLPEELAVVLLHMAKHRGFKSNSKADKASASSSDTGKMLKAVGALQEAVRENGYRTVGEYMARQERKRNRSGPDGKPVYENTMLRSLLEEEAAVLFSRQQDFGSTHATSELLEAYLKAAFFQRPLKSWEDSVGQCLFEKDQKRAPALSYTAERFRLAQRLVNLRMRMPDGGLERIPSDKVWSVIGQMGKWRGLSFIRLKKLIGYDHVTFEGLNYGRRDKKGEIVDPEKQDVCGVSAGCAQGVYTLAGVLGFDGVRDLASRRTLEGRSLLDAVAVVLTMHDDMEKIGALLRELPLTGGESEKLLNALEQGAFAVFRRFFKLSLKAMERILPHMIDNGDYALGCEMAGYDHAKARPVDLRAVRNPVVLRIVSEVRRQFTTIVRQAGVIPGKVCIELLRDVGKSVEERNAIQKGLERRYLEKQGNRKRFADLVQKKPEEVSPTELLRYELWKEQGERCAYYFLWKDLGGERAYEARHGMIAVNELLDGPNAAQIDHILPRSRTFDNRFINLCLARVEANQAKGDRTPWEWLGSRNPQQWHVFEEWVGSLHVKGLKKRNYLLKNLDADMEGRFHERNKHDTSYAARLVQQWIAEEYERLGAPMERERGGAIRRVFARPGRVTADLRKAWGVESLKKDASGRRLGDRHHALDALIVALCTESTLQRMTRAYKQMEQWREKNRLVPNIAPPWETFREDVAKALGSVFVSRKERGKERGRLHEDTLRQIRSETGQDGRQVEMLYERVPVRKLALADLERIKDVERNGWLRDILRHWIERGKPVSAPPRSPKGDVIRRVRVRRGPYTSGMLVPRGDGRAQADNAAIIRTDVFIKKNRYFLVPVYASRIAAPAPPNLAIVPGKEEKDWLEMDADCAFCFSLMKNSYVVAEKGNGEVVEGYFVNTDRSVAAITIAMANDHGISTKIGVKTLKSFIKCRVDRLGGVHPVKKETRTWHGEACT